MKTWHNDIPQCRCCGTPERPYLSRGLCAQCYGRAYHWKELDQYPKIRNGAHAKSEQTKAKMSTAAIGKHRGPMSAEHKHAISCGLKRTFAERPEAGLTKSRPGSQNGMYGRTHTAEARRKIALATIRMLQQQGPARQTQIERILDELLDSMSINHRSQYALYDNMVVDQYLPDYDVVLEAYGDYWHANPQLYPDQPHWTEAQRKNEARDRRRAYFLIRRGHRFRAFWENELHDDIGFCSSEILKVIHQQRSDPLWRTSSARRRAEAS